MPLRSFISKFLFLAITLAAASWYAESAVVKFWAFLLSKSADVAKVERATLLEPRVAEYRFRLANDLFLTDDNLEAAVQQYRAAVDIDPWISRYWLDLSRAYFAMDKTAEQEAAVQSAVRVDPTTPS